MQNTCGGGVGLTIREKSVEKCTGTEMLRNEAACYVSCICIQGPSKAKTGFQGHLSHPPLPTYHLGGTGGMMELFIRFDRTPGSLNTLFPLSGMSPTPSPSPSQLPHLFLLIFHLLLPREKLPWPPPTPTANKIRYLWTHFHRYCPFPSWDFSQFLIIPLTSSSSLFFNRLQPPWAQSLCLFCSQLQAYHKAWHKVDAQ